MVRLVTLLLIPDVSSFMVSFKSLSCSDIASLCSLSSFAKSALYSLNSSVIISLIPFGKFCCPIFSTFSNTPWMPSVSLVVVSLSPVGDPGGVASGSVPISRRSTKEPRYWFIFSRTHSVFGQDDHLVHRRLRLRWRSSYLITSNMIRTCVLFSSRDIT